MDRRVSGTMWKNHLLAHIALVLLDAGIWPKICLSRPARIGAVLHSSTKDTRLRRTSGIDGIESQRLYVEGVVFLPLIRCERGNIFSEARIASSESQ